MSLTSQFVKIGDRVTSSFQNGLYKPAEDYCDEGTRIVRINDYDNDGTKKFNSLRRVLLSEAEIERFGIQRNDILVNRVNSLSHIGKSCIVEDLEDVTVFESNMMRLRLPETSGISPEYLFIVFNSPRARDYFKKVAKPAVAQASINQEDIRSLAVHLPGLKEQGAIASLLSTWDLAIEKGERLITAKQQLLAVHRDRLQHKTPQSKRIKLHEATHESTARNGARLGRDSIMAVTKAVGMRPMKEETIAANIERYKVVRPKGFAYNPMRLNIGSIAMSPFDADILVSPDYVVFECDESKLLPGYLNHLRFSRHWTNYFENAGNGSVRVRIYYDDLAAFAFELPPVEEQERIVDFLDAVQLEIDLLKKQAEAYRRQKRGLMQKLLTGEWRVRLG